MKRQLPFFLLALAIIAIVIATLIEDTKGSAHAHALIYGASWFRVLWGAIVISGSWWCWKKRLWRRLSVCLLHGSLVLILAGALTTSLSSKKGMVMLRQGLPTADYISETKERAQLPFLLRLDTFRIQHYPGTQTPQDYISIVTCEQQQYRISMNKIMEKEGWRFYQTSFDEDLQGSVLTANYDPWGTTITYIGYALLGLSMMMVVINRKKKGKTTSPNLLLLLAFLVTSSNVAHATTLPAIAREQAAAIDKQQVIWNDRVTPMHTLSQEVLLKVYGKRSYHGLTPTQVLASWTLSPKEWSLEPIIKLKDRETAQHLGVQGEYACFKDFFHADGSYKLQTITPSRGIQEADEKIGLILMLLHGTLVRERPEDVPPLSDQRVLLEILYNTVPWTLICFISCFCGALLSLKWKWLWHLPIFCLLLSCYLLRWYIGGRIPLSNGFETMLFVSLMVLLATEWIRKQHPWLLSGGLLVTGCTLLVAHLGAMNPAISQLMPVLHSPWLSAHVSMVMISYALFGLMTVISIIALFSPSATQVRQLTHLCRQLLFPAQFLLGAGIFLGAIWANVSWGSYWSWDPKESWALISFLVYGIAFHQESLPWFRHPRNFHLYIILGFLTILMTWFGVNYLLGGMHSYGAGN